MEVNFEVIHFKIISSLLIESGAYIFLSRHTFAIQCPFHSFFFFAFSFLTLLGSLPSFFLHFAVLSASCAKVGGRISGRPNVRERLRQHPCATEIFCARGFFSPLNPTISCLAKQLGVLGHAGDQAGHGGGDDSGASPAL